MEYTNEIWESLLQLNDTTSDLIMICDVRDIDNFKIIYVNKKMAESFKIEKNKLIGMNLWDVVPEFVVKMRKEQALKVMQSKKSLLFEDERQGRYFLNHYIPIFNENHDVVFGATITKEITEQKRSEKKYEDLVNNIKEGIFALDKTGRFTYVNKIMETRSGFTKDEFYKKNFFDIILADSKKNIKKQFNNLLHGKTVKSIEIRYRNRKGKLIYLEITANPIYENDKVIGIQGITRDITDKKIDEQKLKKSEKNYQDIFYKATEGILVSDSNGIITEINPAGVHILGYSNKKELIGTKTFNLYARPNQRGRVMKILTEKGSINELPLVFKKKDGSEINVFGGATVVKNKKGEIEKIFGIFRDVTELEKNRKKLLDLESQRRKLNERYRLLLENSGCPITYIDLNGKIVLINEIGAKNLNGKPDDFIGKSIYKLIPDYLEEEQKKRTKEILETSNGIIREDVVQLRSGNQWFLSYQQPVIEYNKIVGIQIFSIDITKQKLIENQIKETKNYLNNVIENTKEIIFTVHKDRRISLWNQSAEYVSGVKYRHVKKKRFSEIDFIENHKDVTDFIEDIFSNKTRKLEQIIIKDSYGSTHILKPSVSTIAGEDGDISDIIFICDDITYELDSHEKTLPGSSYVIDAVDNTDLKRLVTGFIHKRKHALFMTREPVEITSQYLKSQYMHIQIFSSLKHMSYPNVKTLDDMKNSIIDFINNNKNPVIFIDRIDYVLYTYGFQELYPVLCEINDIIRKHNALFFMRLNRNLLSEKEYLMINEEYAALPSTHLDTIYLDGSLFEILEFVNQENTLNRTVNQTKILKQFAMSKITAQKRISKLIDSDLLLSKSLGRMKQLYTTRKGRVLIEQKKS